ncbi:MAG: DinB family protein [Saprospiraceae bacterium]|nr:DinB family protein [Saprospiraceae bacterium]
MNSTDSLSAVRVIPRPKTEEAAAYYFKYIEEVEGNDGMQALQNQYFSALNFFKSIPEKKWSYRYQQDKWSIKQVLLHLIDAERVFAYRALRIGRGDDNPIQGFDHEEYIKTCGADDRSPISLIEEYKTVRLSTYSLFENIPSSALTNFGIANDHSVSCRALAWIIAGHENHHIRILKERYLN